MRRTKPTGLPTTIEDERAPGRFVHAREKSKTLPWRRVVVYDCDRNTLEVKHPFELDHKEYERVKLPSGLSQVTIFLDSETVTTPTTKETTPGGDSNVRLAKIYLNRLGFSNSVLRLLGQLSTLYVKKIKPWSETTSLASPAHSIGGGPRWTFHDCQISIRPPSLWNMSFFNRAHGISFLKPYTSSGSPSNKAVNFRRVEHGSPDPGAEALQHYVKAIFSLLGPVWDDAADNIMSIHAWEHSM
ncbi:hypothetical protein MMC22_010738 [Lobaria immixta]|nr:hypothetical protein [Lobaria immixta]